MKTSDNRGEKSNYINIEMKASMNSIWWDKETINKVDAKLLANWLRFCVKSKVNIWTLGQMNLWKVVVDA